MSYDYDGRYDRYDDRYDDRRYDDRYDDRYDAYSTTSRHSHSPSHRSSHALVVRSPHHDDYALDSVKTTRTIHRTRDYGDGHRYSDPDYYDYYSGGVHRSNTQRKVLDRKNMILAAVLGAAGAAGVKEIYDRREAKEHEDGAPHRNLLSSAAIAAAGGLVAYGGADLYKKQKEKKQLKLAYGDDYQDYYGDRHGSGHSRFLESALGATALGALAKKVIGSSSSSHGHYDYHEHGHSNSKLHSMGRTQKAAVASLLAGATEAFRVAKEPGDWKGDKAKRVVTAALGAGAIDRVRDPEKQKHKKLSLLESVVGGLVGNRVINGSKDRIYRDERTGRSRSRPRHGSRSRSRSSSRKSSSLKKIAGATAAAIGTKKLLSSGDSKSRKDYEDDLAYGEDNTAPRRLRGRSVSQERSLSRDRHVRGRSQSVGRRALSKLGLGSRDRSISRERGRTPERVTQSYQYMERRSFDDRDPAVPHVAGTPTTAAIRDGPTARGAGGYYSDEDDYEREAYLRGRHRSPSRTRSIAESVLSPPPVATYHY